MKLKTFLHLTIACLLAFVSATRAQEINANMDLQLQCQVQQGNSITNAQIDTQSLLELIAADQGFTLPNHAKLRLNGSSFVVLQQDNTVTAYVDTNILSVVYVGMVEKSSSTNNTKNYTSTLTTTPVISINYNGSTISFSCNFKGSYAVYNLVVHMTDKAVYTTSYSGTGFGTGTFAGQTMVVTGTLNGSYIFQYSTGTITPPIGIFPTPLILGNPPGAW